MNTEARDPIFRGLDNLAGLADADHVTDRLGGISRKARANRIRTRVAGAAAVAAVVAGAVGVVQLLPNGDKDVQPTPSPTTSANPSALTIDLGVKQIGRTTLGVVYRIHGTSHEWVYAPNETTDISGPKNTRVLLDGQEAGGSDGGDIQCQAETPELAFDETWSGDDGRGVIVNVPGPGTYTLTVQAPSCGADGKLVPNEVSQTVTVTEPDIVVADQTSVDIDGDGRDDQVKLLAPSADQGGGYAVAEVTLASGETTEVQITGTGAPKIGGTADLNGDGVPEVEIDSEGANHSWWTVLTYTGGKVVAAKPILSGAEWIMKPDTGAMSEAYAGEAIRWFQVTFMRDGQLVTLLTDGAWDQRSEAQGTLHVWGLEGSDLSLGGPKETLCITPDKATWTDPAPC
jgi:hypothetical protein